MVAMGKSRFILWPVVKFCSNLISIMSEFNFNINHTLGHNLKGDLANSYSTTIEPNVRVTKKYLLLYKNVMTEITVIREKQL